MVLVRSGGGSWRSPANLAFEDERALQTLVQTSPGLLPGDVPMAVVDEFPVPGIGSADLVGVSASGEITVVECKLRANPEIRRAVVGQLLAYAGGLWHMDYDDFAATFAHRGRIPLAEAVATAVQVDEKGGEVPDPAALREAVSRNLAAGDFRLVIAVDEITPELKTIVRYMNEHTLPTVQVMALELTYARERELELLVPALYGQEAADRKQKQSSASRWTEESFAAAVEERTEGAARAFIDRLLTHGSQNGHSATYGIGKTPSLSYTYRLGGDRPRSVWTLYLKEGSAGVTVNLEPISKWSEDAALTLVAEMRASPALARYLDGLGEGNLLKYPLIPIVADVVSSEAADVFMRALDQLVGRHSPTAPV